MWFRPGCSSRVAPRVSTELFDNLFEQARPKSGKAWKIVNGMGLWMWPRFPKPAPHPPRIVAVQPSGIEVSRLERPVMHFEPRADVATGLVAEQKNGRWC